MYRQFRTSTSPGSRRHPQHLEITGTSYIEAFSKKHVICVRGSHALLHFPQIPSTDAGCSGPKRRHCLCLDIFYLFLYMLLFGLLIHVPYRMYFFDWRLHKCDCGQIGCNRIQTSLHTFVHDRTFCFTNWCHGEIAFNL